MESRPKPKLSTSAYVWFLIASGLQILLLTVVLLAVLSSNITVAGVSFAIFAVLFGPSLLIASSEAERLDESTWRCFRRGYLVGADIFMSFPF
ncbi:MAG: hypothetical protein WA988_11845 [Candidatus Nanopelagicales bacterium]